MAAKVRVGSDELMSKRVSVVLPEDVGEILEGMAKEERRSHSQMGAILIEEAIAEYITKINTLLWRGSRWITTDEY